MVVGKRSQRVKLVRIFANPLNVQNWKDVTDFLKLAFLDMLEEQSIAESLTWKLEMQCWGLKCL